MKMQAYEEFITIERLQEHKDSEILKERVFTSCFRFKLIYTLNNIYKIQKLVNGKWLDIHITEKPEEAIETYKKVIIEFKKTVRTKVGKRLKIMLNKK